MAENLCLPGLRQEYVGGCLSIRQALQSHTSYCLLNDFDQIRQTNLIEVNCCNCGAKFRVPYERVAIDMYCKDCKDVEATEEHIEALKSRLSVIRKRLLHGQI